MTVSSTSRKAGPYEGAGTTGPFTFSFKVFSESDVVVITTTAGAETTLDGTAYTVSLNADQNASPGGDVTLNDALAVGSLLTITSDVSATQSLAITNLGGFFPELINDAFDRVTILCLQLKEQISRAVKTNISSDTTPDELLTSLSGYVASASVDAASAASSASAAIAAAASVPAFGPVLIALAADEDMDGARGTLGLSIGTDIQAFAPTATQEEMEAGTESDLRAMSPLSVAQAIEALNDSHGITLGTPVASTSGTAIDFTAIPSYVKRITVMFNAVSTNAAGGANIIVQIGDSGGIENTGYVGAVSTIGASSVATSSGAASGFHATASVAAAAAFSGAIVLRNYSGNSWVCTTQVARTDSAVLTLYSGIKTLSAIIDRVRITTANGTDAFDAGEINISYE